MSQDHQLTFDWILYVILVPPVLFALWLLYKERASERDARRIVGRRPGEPLAGPRTPDGMPRP